MRGCYFVSLLLYSYFEGALTRNTPPVFVNDMNNFRIAENTPPGLIVYNLTAYDAETEVYYGIDRTDVFYADPVTGAVTLIRPLDYETSPVLHFVTVVEDLPVNGSQAYTVTHNVRVFVIDTNDNEPHFVDHPTEIIMTSDVPPGSVILSLKAADVDTVGDPLAVSCQPTFLPSGRDLCDFFLIRLNYSTNTTNAVTADVILAATVDELYASKADELYATFSVSDGLHASETQIRIVLSGKNGKTTAPFPNQIWNSTSSTFPALPEFLRDDQHLSTSLRFDPPVGLVEIVENWPISFPLPFRPRVISKTPNSTIALKLNALSPPDVQGGFVIQPTSVEDSEFVEILPIRADVTDRERYPTEIHLEIVAVDSRSRVSAVLPVTIRLLDANDNAPVFRKDSYNFTISDDAENNQHVGTAEATDADSDQFGVEGLTYTVLGPWAKYFRPIVRRSDAVEIHTSIPKASSFSWRQLPENVVLVLRVTDTNGTGLYSDVPVSIRIAKAEKHAPVFVSGNYYARLRERSAQLEPPLVLQAYDPDGSLLRYSLDDPTGHVFGIDSHTGAIFVDHPEDVSIANLGRRLHLTALVSDGVHSAVKANVTIELMGTDQKHANQPPRFKTPSYDFILPADVGSGFVVGNVIAEDPEGTAVRYHLVGGGEGNFVLDDETGELSWIGKRLVKDQVFMLTVLASDSANPPSSSTVQLRVTAKGQNTVGPKFTDSVYTAYLSENASVGSDVMNLKVIDPDANGIFSFALRRVIAFDQHGYTVTVAPDGSDLLSYFAFRGTRMILRKSLYDTELSSFHMQISCNDRMHLMEPTAYAFAVLNIVPVQKPRVYTYEFVGLPRRSSASGSNSDTIEVAVPVDVESGGFIYQFHVIELPQNGGLIRPASVVFKLVNGSDFFAIDSATGVVTAAKSLLKAPEWSHLVVEAFSARPGRLRAANLVVRVIKPVYIEFAMLTSQYDIRVPEDAKPGSFVLQTNNTPADPALVRYNLTGPDADVFAIDEKGVVTLAKALDHENKSALAFIVEAMLLSGNGSAIGHATALVAVTVLDVNDNAPIFDNETYSASVLESVPVNSYITHVHANDADSGENGTVSYRLSNISREIAGYINVDPVEGIILTNRPLLGLVGQYRFYVVASDGGGLNSTASFILTVQPISRCQPVWSRSTENHTILEIEENLPAGQLVGYVKAVASHEKCKAKYNFLDPSTGQATGFTNEFELDADSGKISSKVMLDREMQSRYKLSITVRDSEPGSVFAMQTTVLILVKDVNDNEPAFESPAGASLKCEMDDFSECWMKRHPKMYNFSIFENEPNGTVLGVLRATDKDEGENARIYYHLAGENDTERFSLDQSSGRLSTKQPFDYESAHNVDAVVVATNSARLSPGERDALVANLTAPGVAVVSVQILDRNDHGPVFDRDIYLAAISNETMPETLVVLVHAVDPDATGGGVYYRLRRTSYNYKKSVIIEQSVFAIDSVEGDIRTIRQVGQYSQGYFQLTVESSNAQNYTTNLTDSANVKIWIYSPEQLVRIVIQDAPVNITDHADIVTEALGDAIGAHVILQRIEYNRNALGSISGDKVDLLAVFIDRSTEEIMEISRVLAVVDRQGLLLTAASRPDLGLVQILPARVQREKTLLHFSAASIALVVFGCVMFVGLLGFLLLMCYFRYNSIKDAEAAKEQKPEVPKLVEPTFVLPRKLKENPLWDEVERKPYEEQELSMPVSTNAQSRHDASVDLKRTDNRKENGPKDVAPSYAIIHKRQPSLGSARTSDSAEDYYQTLRTE